MTPLRLDPVLVSAPADPIISVAELKEHCRVGHDDEDDYFAALAGAVTSHLEGPKSVWRQNWRPHTWEESFGNVRACQLAWAPVAAIVSLTWIDSGGVAQAADPQTDYRLVPWRSGAVVKLTDVFTPDLIRDRADAITVRYTAGFAEPPPGVKHAAKLLAGHWYEHRESVIVTASPKAMPVPQTLDYLMQPYRRYAL